MSALGCCIIRGSFNRGLIIYTTRRIQTLMKCQNEREYDTFMDIPVFVLSTSSSDKEKCYALGSLSISPNLIRWKLFEKC